MQKKAPVWGKAIGIIMICLGGLGIFIHIYKLIIPTLFGNMPRVMNDLSRLEQHNSGRGVFTDFNEFLGMTSTQSNMLVLFAVLCLGLTVMYIIGGVKLLSVGPANYRFAKLALGAFIALNAIGCAYFFLGHVSLFVKMILMYSVVGLVFDITLLIILSYSNKADYEVGVARSESAYSSIDDSEEII